MRGVDSRVPGTKLQDAEVNSTVRKERRGGGGEGEGQRDISYFLFFVM